MLALAKHDADILRELALRVRDMAQEPIMEERRIRWYAHNALEQGQPMVLAFPEGAWRELIGEDDLICRETIARSWERELRMRIFQRGNIDDDSVTEPDFKIPLHHELDVYGVEVAYEQHGELGAYAWKPPITDLARDLPLLKPRTLKVDYQGSREELALAEDCFGDILEVSQGDIFFWTQGLTWEVIKLMGIEALYLAPYDCPDDLHALMAFLRDEHLLMLDRRERKGLLIDNNRNGYTGSGGVAYTRELPGPDRRPGDPVRLKDLWGFAESQETVGWSPAMFHEFVFPYQIPLLERFGLNCYGCCEPIDGRLADIMTIPRLRRVSVSPWADQNLCAEAFGRKVIFSRKPNPSFVCSYFDEESIRADLRETLGAARECNLELIMKDTHTVQGDKSRIGRWVKIAREEVGR